MLRLLIIEKDKELLKELTEYFEKNNHIKICHSTDDGLNGFNYLLDNWNKIDVLMINLVMKNKDGLSLLRELKERNINIPTIVSSICTSNKMISRALHFNLSGYLIKPYDIKDLEYKIKETKNTESCHEKVDERVMLLLHSLGISSKYKGYKYLKDSIRMFYFNSELEITADIYDKLAVKYNVSKSCIERAMSRAIDIGFLRCKYECVDSIFGNSISLERGTPTNLEFIETIVERLSTIIWYMI